MIVFHVALAVADDYLARRAPHRQAHLERLVALRGAGVCVGGGPAPDGRSVDLVYRVDRPEQLTTVIEEDPYWKAGAWTGWRPRSFSHFVEPWQPVEVVVDGSRTVTIVEGPVADQAMAEFALIELRGAGRLAFGGFLEGVHTLVVVRTADAPEARGWLADSGFWAPETLTARALLQVL